MKGVVFREFVDLVEERYGEDIVDRLLSHPGLSTGGAYTAVGTYDHAELLILIELLSQEIDVEPHELTIEFGKQLLDRLYKSYPHFVDPHDHAFDFLKTIDSVVHTEVKKLYSDAEVPEYHCEQLDDGVLVMDYRSSRPFADLAEGMLLGCIAHFNEPIEVRREPLDGETQRASRFTLTA